MAEEQGQIGECPRSVLKVSAGIFVVNARMSPVIRWHGSTKLFRGGQLFLSLRDSCAILNLKGAEYV